MNAALRCAAALGIASACSGPPGSGKPLDASTDARLAMPRDARASDGSPRDGALADSGPAGPDASLGPLNPFEITLVDNTGFVGVFPGGHRLSDPVAAGSGVAIGDVDGDADLDIVLARCDDQAGGPSVLLRNDGIADAFSFTQDAAFAADFASYCAHAASLVDLDWDGDLDLLIAGHGSVRLFDNVAGSFVEVAGARGLAGSANLKTVAVTWGDLNRDGWMDLFLSRQGYQTFASSPDNQNALFLGRGSPEDYLDVTDETGLAGDGFTHTVAIADLDGDRDLDIYVANDRFSINGEGGLTTVDPDQWLEQTGELAGTPIFGDRAVDFAVDGQRSSMGIALSDRDGDDRPEILVSDFGANHYQVWDAASSQYVDRAAPEGLRAALGPGEMVLIGWGVRYADLDRDGIEEVVVINGATRLPVQCHDRQPDLLLRRPAKDAAFANATDLAGWPYAVACPPIPPDIPLGGRGVALGDLDGDGDDDLVVSPYAEQFRFYRNDTPAPAHHYLRIRPTGSVIGPDPVGAVLRVVLADGSDLRRLHAAGGETLAQSDRVLEAALGVNDASDIVSATLLWPSGYSQRLDTHPDFALDSEWALVEPDWLTLSARSASAIDPIPVLTFRPMDENGDLLGPGLTVIATRSDGIASPVADGGDGSYTVLLIHPGAPDYVQVGLSLGGVALAPRLALRFE